MFHHVSLGTDDADRAARFYDPVLAVLGITRREMRDGSIDYGSARFMFSLEKPTDGKAAMPGNGVHVAFDAGNRQQVDDFYRVALEQGGTDAGPPGLRPEYNANYYGAFVFDLDGNKIEAVTYSAD